MTFIKYKEPEYAIDGIPLSNLSNRPKRFKIVGDTDIAAECSGGGGIEVRANDGTTILPIELVQSGTNLAIGNVEFWTKLDLLSTANIGDPYCRVYYDSAEITVEDHAGVWNNYAIVTHLEEDPSGGAPQMYDSVSESNLGTSAGSMTSGDSVAAQIGKGLDFDGSDDMISIPSAAIAALGGSFTLRLLYNTGSLSGFLFGISNGSDTNTFDVGFEFGAYTLIKNGSNSDAIGSPPTGAWTDLVVTHNAGTNATEVFQNGSSIGNIAARAYATPTTVKTLGSLSGPSGGKFTGQIDELSLSFGVHSNDWIAYSYQDDFFNADTFTLGPEQGGETFQILSLSEESFLQQNIQRW